MPRGRSGQTQGSQVGNRLAANKIIKDAVRVKVGAVRVKVASKRRREVRLENDHAQVYNWISGGSG